MDGKGLWGREEMKPPAHETEMPPSHARDTAETRGTQDVLPALLLSGDPVGQMLVATKFTVTVPATWK